MSLFANRREAGKTLGEVLSGSNLPPDTLVLGLPRGGIPVALEVARRLGAPLDVFVVRKLGVPGSPELGMGAIATGDVEVFNEVVIRRLGIPQEDVDKVVALERQELHRRERIYRRGNGPIDMAGRTVIIVDDGIATGSTMAVAVRAVARRKPKRVIVATPVASEEAVEQLGKEADQVVACATPSPFFGVGSWYRDFAQTTDEEVRKLLEAAPRPAAEAGMDELIHVDVSGALLEARLQAGPEPVGMVVFAHGSGSSRHSERNMQVAEIMRHGGLATILLDLLTLEEQREDKGSERFRFQIPLLGKRVAGTLDWLDRHPDLQKLPMGIFGASTGAAAALLAAKERKHLARCVVSRGGRPDLAGDALRDVQAPTLLIVGGDDLAALELNRRAAELIAGPVRLEIVPGASHLFIEPGTLEAAAHMATDWFTYHLGDAS